MNNSLISKNESDYIKGIAVFLMLFHHLFAFPNRQPKDISIINVIETFNLEMLIGQYGKYCVPIFLFIAGYGYAVANKK
ncbi:acyltransferase family protein, partial [Necropsobacter rosorum]|uniref:acyltransferase family protein n=1 Tax=Necropsobacter rosorum TaxID=908285 RepID=UPI003C7BCEE7